eukprot:5180639-Pyramimonas_sp.AAC.1
MIAFWLILLLVVISGHELHGEAMRHWRNARGRWQQALSIAFDVRCGERARGPRYQPRNKPHPTQLGNPTLPSTPEFCSQLGIGSNNFTTCAAELELGCRANRNELAPAPGAASPDGQGGPATVAIEKLASQDAGDGDMGFDEDEAVLFMVCDGDDDCDFG